MDYGLLGSSHKVLCSASTGNQTPNVLLKLLSNWQANVMGKKSGPLVRCFIITKQSLLAKLP